MNFIVSLFYSCRCLILQDIYFAGHEYDRIQRDVIERNLCNFVSNGNMIIVSTSPSQCIRSRLFILFRGYDLYIMNSFDGEVVGKIIYESLKNKNGETSIDYIFTKVVEVLKSNELSGILEIYITFDCTNITKPEAFRKDILINNISKYKDILSSKLDNRPIIVPLSYEMLTEILKKKNNVLVFDFENVKIYMEKFKDQIDHDEILNIIQERRNRILERRVERFCPPSDDIKKSSDIFMFAIFTFLRELLKYQQTNFNYSELATIAVYLINKEKCKELYEAIWTFTDVRVQHVMVYSYNSYISSHRSQFDRVVMKLTYQDLCKLQEAIENEKLGPGYINENTFLLNFLRIMIEDFEKLTEVIISKDKKPFNPMEMFEIVFRTEYFKKVYKQVEHLIQNTFIQQGYIFDHEELAIQKAKDVLAKRIVKDDILPKDLLSEKGKKLLRAIIN